MSEKVMDLCVDCGNRMTHVVLEQLARQRRGAATVIFEDVPCLECPRCGQRYYDGPMMKLMEEVLDGRVAPTGKTEVATFSLRGKAA
jgi:YgiT-type zinc finger domain-containing protein